MPCGLGWAGHAIASRAAPVMRGLGLAGEPHPEVADLGRLARWALRHVVGAARAEESSARHLLTGHLGPRAAALPVAVGWWPWYDQVNVQAGLDAWLAQPGRHHQVMGLTGFHDRVDRLADLARPGMSTRGIGVGDVATTPLPAGPDGATRPCARCALYLVTDPGGPLAVLIRGPGDRGGDVTVGIIAADRERPQRALSEIRCLAFEHNVFRGHVIEFGGEVPGPDGAGALRFPGRPRLERDQVVLPADVLEGIERQVLGVARHSGRLFASGQHLKRGVLLHGPPGGGKTHTVRYLLAQSPGVTAIIVPGSALASIADACSLARALQPAIVVVEDVDLIAEHRESWVGPPPLLSRLLNEMDGIGEDLDVTFLLTTNRPDLLEPALADRPGRVDHAARLPLPDGPARRRLLDLYTGALALDMSDPEAVIARTEGVTASFIKELLRRAALYAAEDTAAQDTAAQGPAAPAPGALRVTDAHLNAALDHLLAARNQLTRALLGAGAAPGTRPRLYSGPGRQERRAIGSDAVIPHPAAPRRRRD